MLGLFCACPSACQDLSVCPFVDGTYCNHKWQSIPQMAGTVKILYIIIYIYCFVGDYVIPSNLSQNEANHETSVDLCGTSLRDLYKGWYAEIKSE